MRSPAPRSPAQPGPRRILQRALRSFALGFVAVVAVACESGGSPGPTPADFTGIAASLRQQGIVIGHVVSGEAGCPDSVLMPTAISFDAQGLDQAAPVRVHLYIFRDGSVYSRLRSEVDQCARTYVVDPGDYATVDISPYVAAGVGPWAAKFRDGLRTGLAQAATPDTAGP
jgi:hypothetical protein